MSPDVDKYFSMLKDQFSSDHRGRRSSASGGASRSSAFQRRFETLSTDISPKYHRHSMAEGNNLFASKQLNLEFTKSTESLNKTVKRDVHDSDHMFDKVFSNSFTSGDFRDLMNNNDSDIEDLQSKHMESALNQGKLYSVSEENRKRRKKVFRDEKERKCSK